MEKGWAVIYSSTAIDVELRRGLLHEHGINAVVINKQDSAYLFGDAELYVPQDEVIRSKKILDEENA